MTDTDRFADALTVARHFDEDAFACDFGGRTAINLPNLDAVISLTQPAAPAEGREREAYEAGRLAGYEYGIDLGMGESFTPAAPAEGLDVDIEYHTPQGVIDNWRKQTKAELIGSLLAYHEGMAELQRQKGQK